MRRLSVAAMALLLGACSSLKPWLNQPIGPASPLPSAATVHVDSQQAPPSIVAAITLSGGGARAAAFGLGVLTELQATRFFWEGRDTSVLDHVGLVSGVSGGSILATYYAAFGERTFSDFEREFLLADFQAGLLAKAFAPRALYRMSSPWYGRTDVLAASLDKLYQSRTFADLQHRQHGPRLLVTATDLTTGAPFEFTPEQFALICSDLNSVPLSYAVAASSAVPLLLSPVTLRNYAGACPQSAQVVHAMHEERNLPSRLLNAIVESYLDAEHRPYLHLVDGGLVDNLGVRGLLDRSAAGGSLDSAFQNLLPGSVHKVILISVDSERDVAERIDSSAKVPGTLQVLDALVFGAGSRATKETLASMQDNARRWTEELAAVRGKAGSPFAADAQVHVISVALRDVKDRQVRSALLQVPTALTILPLQVRQLEAAGRAALRESPEFIQLRSSLGAHSAPVTHEEVK